MPSIAITIPVRNRSTYTQQILLQIFAQLPTVSANKIFVVVVDDGSTDGTSEMIQTQFPDVHLIRADGSLWWTGAICQAMTYAIQTLDTDYVLWLNDDIFLFDDFLQQLDKICQTYYQQFNIIGGIIRDKTYPNWIVFSGMVRKTFIRHLDQFTNAAELEVDTLNGNIVLIPRKVIDQIGLPSTDRFQHYGGDFEYVLRAKKAGCKILLSRQLQASTDYQSSDLIRYMPPWMQWQLSTTYSRKWNVIQGLLNLKAHHNIWHLVNIEYSIDQPIPSWKYGIFYIRQLLKIAASNLWSEDQIKRSLDDYLSHQQAPAEVKDAVRDRVSKSSKNS
jgi:GT2 family glycosyltransferase